MDHWLLLKYLQTIIPRSSVLEAFCIHWQILHRKPCCTAHTHVVHSVVTMMIPMATKRKSSFWTTFKTIGEIEFPCHASNEVFMMDNCKESRLVYSKESWNSYSLCFYLDAELSVRCWQLRSIERFRIWLWNNYY